jgi:hypothetical protein
MAAVPNRVVWIERSDMERVHDPTRVLLRIQVTDGNDDLTVLEVDITKTGDSLLDEKPVHSLSEKEVRVALAVHKAREMVRTGGTFE